MPLYSRKQVLLAKAEATYGTSSAPEAADAVLVSDLEVTPLAMEMAERTNINGILGQRDQVVTQRMVQVNFAVELAGSGAAGTAPRWGPVIKACGFSETVSASTSVTYAPISSSFSSVTLDFYNDGIRHLVVGARGTWSLSMAVGEIPRISFELMGWYTAPTALANVTPTYANQATPLAVNSDNTPTVTVHSLSACLQAYSLELGNQMVFRQLAGCTKETLITDRQPTGSLTIELPPIGTKDFFAIASAQTKGSIAVTHGTAAGNIATITTATAAFDGPTFEDGDGIQHIVLPFRPIPTSAGNNEMSLVLT